MGSRDNYGQRLEAAAHALGLGITPDQRDALLNYLDQLQRWNRTYNLTALRDPEQMLIQHIFDSLAVLPPLTQTLYKKTVENVVIIDVGSGAGLPGAVMAIMQPGWSLRCVDAVEKKMAFVRQISGALHLPNLQAVHQRVETLAPYDADIVVSRAFASLVDFASLAGRHVAKDGCLLAMKGREPVEEIDALHRQTDWRVSRIQSLLVPELNAQRCLVWMSQQGTL
ncbi:16S rRNA (guanine(527)-N(7))-methyltransferase RsmG [Pollutimonas sp. H1-120]|uniref:16S rRNA (guanine(527)-N(7))-methyltransferase RsmG n=1 Tax=Pollutimonas sp. H1-120 TaxID=3148824 RepID=UPI003B524B8F